MTGRTWMAVARTAGIMLCLAFLLGSMYLPETWSQDYPGLAMAVLGMGIACAVGLFFVLAVSVVRWRRE